MKKINIGIIGYGNLGKGVEKSILNTEDLNLIGIFTRRNPKDINSKNKAYHIDELINFKDKIDVCILCGGSATDLIKQGPDIAKYFNTVDSYDTHANIPEYFNIMDKASKEGNNVSMISTGWDPGLFSLNRLLFESILPKGETYTFWGKGVSQGHSDAVRRINGVKKAIQYTIPNEKNIEKIKNGEKLNLSTREKHFRECFVVTEDNADLKQIENDIKTMKNYFDEYDTSVHFIDEEEFNKNHTGMPHGGQVIRLGNSSDNINQVMSFSLNLESNPEFTASVSVACARAVYKLSQNRDYGCKTIFDIPLKYLSPNSDADIVKRLL